MAAAPFIEERLGGKTSLAAYWHYAKYLGGDWGRLHFDHKFSISWQFISKDTFESQLFQNGCKAAILFLNVYFFFLKQNSFKRCWANLQSTAKASFAASNLSQADSKFALECLLVLQMAGITLTPGGHTQMQFFTRYVTPVLIHMTGLPVLAIFWCYQSFFPVDHLERFFKAPELHDILTKQQQYSHIFQLLLVAYLVFIGPREWVYTAKTQPPPDKQKKD